MVLVVTSIGTKTHLDLLHVTTQNHILQTIGHVLVIGLTTTVMAVSALDIKVRYIGVD